MQSFERERHVARIIAAKTKFRIGGTTLYSIAPTREQRFIANEVYRDARREAEYDGILTDSELYLILLENGIWSESEEDNREKLTTALEDLKVGLYENRLRSNAKFSIRQAIRKTREEMIRLDNIRHSLDYLTVDGLALSAKYRYLTGACLIYENGLPYWTDESWNLSDPFIDTIVDYLAQERLGEIGFRELARNEPWRSMWGAKDNGGRGLFDCAAVDLTDDQRGLILWSNIYDNIREHPDCPADDIFDDDDMMDGWLILARRKREAQQASQQANSLGGNQKIKQADEIFVVADTIEDARAIDKMNDMQASLVKNQRLSYLKQKGVVNEGEMPDQARKIAMEKNRLEALKLRQGKG